MSIRPTLGAASTESSSSSIEDAVLELREVTKRFGQRIALDGVDLALRSGTTLGIVGESGSGKSTCVRLALGLDRPTAGTVLLRGTPYPRSTADLREIRRQLGFVFQDPYDSLDPRMNLRAVVGEPLRIHRVPRREIDERVSQALGSVGLPDAPLDSYPSAYSGGGRQRIAIARALVLDPDVLLCDEPTASLDVSVQAQILNLLLRLKATRKLSVVFVSHDLDLIRRVSDEITVMHAGRVVETGPAEIVATRPRHPYTVALLSSIPADHPSTRKLTARLNGTPTTQEINRSACVFATRCPKAQPVCWEKRPPIKLEADGVRHACYFPEQASP